MTLSEYVHFSLAKRPTTCACAYPTLSWGFNPFLPHMNSRRCLAADNWTNVTALGYSSEIELASWL